MLAKRIIPCLDVKDGRVVKGVRFVGLRDAGDPVEAARRYDAEGADEITFLDITASHEERRALFDVIARTADVLFTPLTVGGGVRSEADIAALLDAGADKVSINTAAVDPARQSILANSEDGWLYRWDLATNSFTQKVPLTNGLAESYTPTAIGADGKVYAINNAVLFAVGL